jgi:translocation and assembly module TamB
MSEKAISEKSTRRKRFIGWTLAGLAALIAVLVIGGYFYLKSGSFQQFALRKIVQQTEEATGGRTEIAGMDFDLSTLTAHLYNITVHGTEGPGQPPLLHADKLTVRIKILSALKREVNLRELLIDRPVVHFQVNRAGKNNLPVAPPSQNSSHTNVFDLAVGHVQLTNGEINYNDRKTPLEANLYDLGTDIRFASLAKRYEGELSYKNGQLKYAQYDALPHNADLKFSVSQDRFILDSANLNLGSSAVTLRAEVTNYSNPVADGDYRIQIHTLDFAKMSPGISPAGDVVLDGKLHYQAVGTDSFIRDVSINGRLASEALAAAASGNRVDLRKLRGEYQLAGGRLQIANLSMESLGGRIIAKADVQHLDTTPDSRIQAALHNISLRALQQSLHRNDLKAATVSGTLNGKADVGWRGSISNLRAHSDLTLRASAGKTSNPSGTEVPVNGAIHMTYDGPRQTISLRDTSLRIPSATLIAQGEISNHSSLAVQVAATDLHQLAALASSFGATFGTTPSAPPAISGSANLNAMVTGSLKQPMINGQLNAQNLNVDGSEWKTARFDLRANPSEFSVQNGSLIDAQQGQASFSASVTLRDWSYQAASPIKANLAIQQLRMSDVQRLAGQHYPISGDLSAKLSLQGSQLDPAGSGTAQIANARAYNEPIRNLALQFRAASGTVVSTLNVAAPAGTINADLSYTPKTKAYKVRLEAPSLTLQKLQTIQAKDLQLTGTVSASASGEGTLDNPQLTASVQLPQLQVRQNSISGLKADLLVANHYADLNLDSRVSQASVHAHGRVALTGNYYTEAAIDTGSVPLDVLLATYANGVLQGFSGQTEFHATLKGPLKDQSQVQAHLTIPVLNASYQSWQIGIASPIHADYSNSVVTLQPAEIRGTGTSLRIQGRVPLAGTSPATLAAHGSLDVRILKIVAPDVESSGVVALDVRASGTASNPAVQGQVDFKDVAVSTPDAPVGITKLNGTVDVTNDHLQIAKLNAQVGGGPVSIGGSIAYRPSLQFNIALQGQGMRLRYPDGLRSLLDANLAFSGTPQASTLNGRVLIDNLAFTQDFDLAKFADQFSTGTTTPSQPGFADNVNLSIRVQSQENLSATSSQISIAGRVALQVGGTAADPVITGRTNLTSGEMFYRNVRYELQKGVITFDDPNHTHPVMNVSVATTVKQYDLTLTLRGPLDKLTTSYVSDPPLATADIINLVARGKTTQEADATSQSTDSMIASQAASQLSSSVQKLAGISSLQIDPLIGGNNSNPSARVAMQQRVTKDLLFSFSTDLSQPGSEIIQGQYQINKRWSVSLSRDEQGGVSVDGRFHTRF